MLSYVLRQFAVRRGRTLLCLLGVAVSVAMIISILSISHGMRNSLNSYMEDSGASLIVFDRSAADLAFSKVTEEDIRKVREVPGVVEIARGNFTMIMGPKLGKDAPIAAGLGVIPVFGRFYSERMIRKYKDKLVSGRLPEKRSELLLGELVARKLKVKVGDRFPLFREEFLGITEYEVAGIFESDLSWENLGVVAHAEVVQQKTGPDFALLFVYTAPEDTSKAREEIEKRLPGLVARPANEFTDRFNEQIAYIDDFIFLLSIIAGIVGILGVLNTMMMSVSERTREIGTLRALGWSGRRVLGVIVIEGLLISIVGGLLGLLFGYVGTELLLKFFSRGYLVAAYLPDIFLRGILLALVVGITGSIYPALRASSLKPAEALRYE